MRGCDPYLIMWRLASAEIECRSVSIGCAQTQYLIAFAARYERGFELRRRRGTVA